MDLLNSTPDGLRAIARLANPNKVAVRLDYSQTCEKRAGYQLQVVQSKDYPKLPTTFHDYKSPGT